MNYRNPVFTADSAIDCEIDHPTYGWIPFTCNPNDRGAAFDTAALYTKMKSTAAPYTPPAPPAPEAIQAQMRAARAAAYTAEADPLFFKWQAGESTEADWLAKREQIRARYPYPGAA
jgi:hypothetical protein